MVVGYLKMQDTRITRLGETERPSSRIKRGGAK